MLELLERYAMWPWWAKALAFPGALVLGLLVALLAAARGRARPAVPSPPHPQEARVEEAAQKTQEAHDALQEQVEAGKRVDVAVETIREEGSAQVAVHDAELVRRLEAGWEELEAERDRLNRR